VLCCEIQSCHARRHNDLGGQSSFSSTSLVSLFCAWNITTVEINSSVQMNATVDLHSISTDLKVKSAKCLCLYPVVLVLLFWSFLF